MWSVICSDRLRSFSEPGSIFCSTISTGIYHKSPFLGRCIVNQSDCRLVACSNHGFGQVLSIEATQIHQSWLSSKKQVVFEWNCPRKRPSGLSSVASYADIRHDQHMNLAGTFEQLAPAKKTNCDLFLYVSWYDSFYILYYIYIIYKYINYNLFWLIYFKL